jgi:alkaline phosphatase
MGNGKWMGKVAVLATAAAFLAGLPAEATARGGPRREARHIILFVGDGMQLEHEIATSRYLYGSDRALSFHGLAYKGFLSTWDVSAYNLHAAALGVAPYAPVGFDPAVGYDPDRGGRRPYPLQTKGIDESYFIPAGGGKPVATDSASAATAWATGTKTDDGNIAWAPGDPAGGALTTIAERLRNEKGYAIGVVSTVPFTHATPAAHVSHNVTRNDYLGIGREIVRTTQPEVVIGGGYPGVGGAGYRYIGETDYRFLSTPDLASPYRFVERQDNVDGSLALLEAADQAVKEGKKLFGLFGGPGGNFQSPVPHDLPGMPLVTRADSADPLLKDATVAALQVLSQDDDGFFVMIEQGDIDWANHGNDYRRMIGTTWDLHEAVRSAIDFVNRPGDDIDWSNTLMLVTADHANSFMRLQVEMPAGDLPSQVGTCGSGGPACTYPDGEVTYATTQHTNELVMLYAHGIPDHRAFKRAEGAWYPCTRIIDNTQLYHLMAEAAGIQPPAALDPQADGPARCGRYEKDEE